MQLTRGAPPAARPVGRRVSRCRCASASSQPQAPHGATRRALLAAPLLLAAVPLRARAEGGVTVEADAPGFGKRAAAEGDLLLVHYKGTLSNGETFDSTLGGAVVRTSGTSASVQPAPAVPRAVSLRAGDVQPGVCDGLKAALLGMRVGGTRTVTVPPELGFGQARASQRHTPRAHTDSSARADAGGRALRRGSAGVDLALRGAGFTPVQLGPRRAVCRCLAVQRGRRGGADGGLRRRRAAGVGGQGCRASSYGQMSAWQTHEALKLMPLRS